MRKIKALELLTTVAVISAGVCACGGGKEAEKPVTQEQQANNQGNADSGDKVETESKEAEVVDNAGADAGSDLAEQLKAILSIGYAGADQEGDTIYWAVDEAASSGLFLLVPADGSEQHSLVGDIVSEEGSDKLTITDQSTGDSLTLKVEQITDSEGDTGIQLTTANGDVAALFPVPVDKVIDAMLAVGQ